MKFNHINNLLKTFVFIICIKVVYNCVRLDNNIQACSTVEDIQKEGDKSWTYLVLRNAEGKQYELDSDSFKSVPNVRDYELHGIKTIKPGTFRDSANGIHYVNIFESDLEVESGVFKDVHLSNYAASYSRVKLLPRFLEGAIGLNAVLINYNNMSKPVIEANIFNNNSTSLISVGYSGIEELEDGAFDNLPNLSWLSLNGNQLKNFKSHLIFGSKPSPVTNLLLRRNKLKTITKDMFTTLPNLVKLNIEFNNIEYIENGAFDKLTSLNYLDISNNVLKEISPQVFPRSGLPKLNVFLILNNNLTFINTAIFYRLPKLGFLACDGNPYQCPCWTHLKETLDKRNISRICSKDYSSGSRPSCIVSRIAPDECVYDSDVTNEIIAEFSEVLKEYPLLALQCDASANATNASLTDFN